MTSIHVHRLAAFTDVAEGGNPAGVVLTDEPLADEEMQRIAAEVGYSETAFCTPSPDDQRRWAVRYFAPTIEVPFCGHATIAAGVLLGGAIGEGELFLDTRSGEVRVAVDHDAGGRRRATLTSVPPHVEPAGDLLDQALGTMTIGRDELDPRYPPALAYAGARHLIIVVATRRHLGQLDYDFDALRAVMERARLTTVAVLLREREDLYHARNLFPVGGVEEDPATGAAAAAFGAYLRSGQHLAVPATLEIVQGVDMGRPSRLGVTIPTDAGGGIEVTGTAVEIAGPPS
jgi:PhzF family phenazine biosynthesis protein